MSDAIRMVNDGNFEAEVRSVKDIPVVVDFWAPWCGPCRMLAPSLEKIADERAGAVVVAKYNVDESQEVAAENGIRSIPTILVYKNGEVVGRHTGAVGKAQLDAFIDQYC